MSNAITACPRCGSTSIRTKKEKKINLYQMLYYKELYGWGAGYHAGEVFGDEISKHTCLSCGHMWQSVKKGM